MQSSDATLKRTAPVDDNNNTATAKTHKKSKNDGDIGEDDVIGAKIKVAQEIEDVRKELEKVKGSIRKVEEAIEKIEKDIEQVEWEIDDASANERLAKSDDDKQQWLDEKSKLRDKEIKWMDKENEQRDEKLKLMDKENALHDRENKLLENLGKQGTTSPIFHHKLYAMIMAVKLPSEAEIRSHPDGIVVDVGAVLLRTLFNIQSSKLFVRACYAPLYATMPFGNKARIVITGTPGIAKSVSLLYVLIRRVQEGHPTAFHRNDTKDTWLFLPSGTCQFLRTLTDRILENIGMNQQFVVLMDRIKGNPTNYPDTRGVAILSSTPKRDNYNWWQKTNGGQRLYMPLWTLEELLKYRAEVRPDMNEATVRERYSLVGGVVRAIIPWDDSFYGDYVKMLRAELGRKDLFETVLRFDCRRNLLQDKGDNVCHSVIHYYVDNEFYLKDLKFCSPVVVTENLDRLEKKTPAQLWFTQINGGVGYEQAILRCLPYCARILAKDIHGQSFSVVTIPWGEQGKDDVKEKIAAEQIDRHLREQPAAPTILIPKAGNFGAFDGFLYDGRKWMCLQVTIGKTKTLTPHLLRQFYTKHPALQTLEGKFEWYCVTPPSKAARKQYFGYESDEDAKWAQDHVTQHVIPFPRVEDPGNNRYTEEELDVLRQMKLAILKMASQE